MLNLSINMNFGLNFILIILDLVIVGQPEYQNKIIVNFNDSPKASHGKWGLL